MAIDNDKRIKKLEEEISWMQKDIINLINIIENVEPEAHYHVTYHFHTKPSTDDQSQSDDLNDFI